MILSGTSSTNLPRILIVDDDEDIVLTLKTFLESNRFFVDAFNDPEEALSNFIPNFYDILLIDIRMPRMNGFELFTSMEIVDPNVKVCFMSSFDVYYKSLQEAFPNTSTKCFIKKPVDPIILVNRLMQEIISKK